MFLNADAIILPQIVPRPPRSIAFENRCDVETETKTPFSPDSHQVPRRERGVVQRLQDRRDFDKDTFNVFEQGLHVTKQRDLVFESQILAPHSEKVGQSRFLRIKAMEKQDTSQSVLTCRCRHQTSRLTPCRHLVHHKLNCGFLSQTGLEDSL